MAVSPTESHTEHADAAVSLQPARYRAAAMLVLGIVAIAAMLNAWTFSYATSIPLVQSDAWIFLDTYVRKYLEGDFGWRDFFLQGHSSDTNLPLHKLVLLFHINHFSMDFKVEGLIGAASGIGLVLLLAAAAAGPNPSRWNVAGYALLAWLALVILSLNSSNVYTWPLATMWFLNVLLVTVYLVIMARPGMSPWTAAATTVVLGLLLDEVALVAVLSAVAALMMVRDATSWRSRAKRAAAALAGLVLVRSAYALFNAFHGVAADPATGAGLLQGLAALVSPDGLRMLLLPLGDSLIHLHARQDWFASGHQAVGYALGAVLLAAHFAFWWIALASRGPLSAADARLRRVAVALMLVFYGTLAGIMLQRVPVFGLEYVHQPRYVLFYHLNLAALGLMAFSWYRAGIERSVIRRLGGSALPALLIAMAVLQWHLSVRSWQHAKHLSVYVEGVARTLGQLSIDPGTDAACADILTVCDFPPQKRAQMLDLLVNYRLNVFNPGFQALYRLQPLAVLKPSDAPSSLDPPQE
jgi:hypothetical protein